MRILLVNPRFNGVSRNFPLGLGYIASVARAAGHEVEALDVNALGLTDAEIESRLAAGRWDVFGLTGLVTEFRFMKWLSETIRRLHPNAKIVAGGGLASVVTEHLLRNTPIDVAVIGEGEATFPELLAAFASGRDREEVSGVAFLRAGELVAAPPREFIDDLDRLPLPAWDLFPVDFYSSGAKKLFNCAIRSMNVEATRGCPFHCAFCYKEAWGSKVRRRSVSSVINELKELKTRYGIQAVAFVDDLFTAKRSWTVEFCERMQSEKVGVHWACNSRVDTMDDKLLSIMRRGGCLVVAYGLESGSPTILKAMRKQADIERAAWAVAATRRAGIEVLPYMAMGMPEETEATMAETVDFCRRTRLYTSFSIITPMPGSEVYRRAAEMGRLPEFGTLLENWQHYGRGVTVNMTQMTDAELFALKDRAERQILRAYLLHGWRHYLARVWRYFRAFGPRAGVQVLWDGFTKAATRVIPARFRGGPK